jgi:hypothetical protein
MTRAVINESIWLIGLLLQIALLVAVYRRGISRRLPLFSALLAFYFGRSLLLRLLVVRLAPETYAVLYDVLSLADILLQFLVALEIGNEILRVPGDRRVDRALLVIPAATIAGLATVLFIHLIPGRTRMPPDRFQIFDSLFMILLCAWSFRRSVSRLVRHAIAGLAVVAAVGLLAMVGRNQAAMHHDPQAFAFWAYTMTVAYLLVVLYWIVFFKWEAE